MWPSTNFVVSFSGGRTSAMLLVEMVRRWGPIPSHGVVCFQNTGKEHEKTLEFVRDVGVYCSTSIHWIEFDQEVKWHPLVKLVDFNTASRDGTPFKKAIQFEKGYIPSHQRRFCTKKLKFETMTRFLTRNKGWKQWINIVGLRADEQHRMGKMTFGRTTKMYPLLEWGITKEMVAEFWKQMPFDLELPVAGGRNFLGNCTGCFLKSEFDLALLCEHDPEEFRWWEQLEIDSGTTFKNGWSYTELRQRVESGTDKFKVAGYFCQADEGECTG